jgi:hypothetical protein
MMTNTEIAAAVEKLLPTYAQLTTANSSRRWCCS